MRGPLLAGRLLRAGAAAARGSGRKSIIIAPPPNELGHWTGHSSRLNRKQGNAFGSADYAREELVDELTVAYVCASLSIAPTVRHADYLGRWLDVLRADNRAIFRAASQASKAADYLLACSQESASLGEIAA